MKHPKCLSCGNKTSPNAVETGRCNACGHPIGHGVPHRSCRCVPCIEGRGELAEDIAEIAKQHGGRTPSGSFLAG